MVTRVPVGKTSGPYAVRAVDRVLDVLDALRARPRGASLAEIAGTTGLPRSSVFRYLATLEARGYVERDSRGSAYRLGMGLADAPPRLSSLAATAKPHLEELRDRLQDTVNLGILDGTRVTYLEILESPMAFRFAARAGDRNPIHCTALGKALAAQLDDGDIRRILAAEGMARVTPRTITQPTQLLREIAEVRRHGFAIESGENEEGGGCVAVAISGFDVPAAVSVSAPDSRLSPERVEEVVMALREVAARVEDEFQQVDA